MIWLFGLAQLWVISLLVHFLLDNKVTNNGTDLIHIAQVLKCSVEDIIGRPVDTMGPTGQPRREAVAAVR
jgi:hypothetical protein